MFTSDVWIIKVGYHSQLLDIDKGALNTYDELQLQQFQQQQKKVTTTTMIKDPNKARLIANANLTISLESVLSERLGKLFVYS